MKIPVIKGVIERRILVNFQIDPEIMAKNLPKPFRPKLYRDKAIGGVCLIRLKHIRPRFIPLPLGLQSENAAHRIAVEWTENGETLEGVYIPRRDTNSHLNVLVGGRLFPGEHHRAAFRVKESQNNYDVTMQSEDGEARVHVTGTPTNQLPENSVFSNLTHASNFFEKGSLGYSLTKDNGRFNGLELRCKNWHVEALQVNLVESSYFKNQDLFPEGSVEFDCALLMKNIHHQWHGKKDLFCQ